MKKRKLVVDQLVKDAIGDGDISHLPGAGQPLRLESDPHTPADLRAAHKIMADHDVVPEWVANRKLLDQTESDLKNQLLEKAKKYVAARQTKRKPEHREWESILEDNWVRYTEKFKHRSERYNRDLLNNNLTAPPGIAHKSPLNSEELIERALQAAFNFTESVS